MANHVALCWKFVTGGPYGYAVLKEGLGQKVVIGVATLAAAFDGIRADVAAQLAGETVQKVHFTIFGVSVYESFIVRTADGLYAYTLGKDAVIQSEVTGLANLTTTLNAVRDAAGTLIGADPILRMTVTASSS